MRIILSHDIDSINRPLLHILKRARRFSAKDFILHVLGIKNLYNNIEDVVSLESEYGYHSTFFIPVFLFNLNDIIDILKTIKKEKWDLQLHYIYEKNQYYSLFKLQKNRFNNLFGDFEGIRVHMLVISDKLIDTFVREGIKYDSSYRAEEVNRYDPYIIRKNLIEFPIGVMDADLFGRLHLSEREAFKYVISKIDKAREKGYKYFVTLFHQESFRMRGGRIYKNILKHLSSHGYEASSFKEVFLTDFIKSS